MPEPLSRLPSSITAGFTLAWSVPQGDFDPGTWELRYVILAASLKHEVIEGAGDGGSIVDAGNGSWTVTLSPTVTTAFTDGAKHRFVGYVTDGTDEYVVDQAVVLVKADPKAATGEDPRSDDEQILDAAIAMMKGKATVDQQALAVAGRSLSRYSFDDLERIIAIYRERVREAREKDRIRRGLPSSRKVKCRMVPVS